MNELNDFVDFTLAHDLVTTKRGHHGVGVLGSGIPDLGTQDSLVWETCLHGYQSRADVASQVSALNVMASKAVSLFAIKGEFFTLCDHLLIGG